MLPDKTEIQAFDLDGEPMPAGLPASYRERWREILGRTDTADTIFATISNGGTLIQLAECWGVRHSDIAGWIGSTVDLRERYNTAVVARNEWEQERLLQELRAIATVDIRQAYADDGSFLPIKSIPANVAASISGIDSLDTTIDGIVSGKIHKIKFWDKSKAIEIFLKKHGLLVERHNVEVTTRLEDLITAANDATVIDAVVVKDSAPLSTQQTAIVSDTPKEGTPTPEVSSSQPNNA